MTLDEYVAQINVHHRKHYPHWDVVSPYHWRVNNLRLIQSDVVAHEYLMLVAEDMKRGKPSAIITISFSEAHDAYDLRMSFNARTWTGRIIEYGSHFHDWLGGER